MEHRCAKGGGVNPSPPESAGGAEEEDRFEAMLEARFAKADRRGMARQMAEHDRGRPGDTFDRDHVRRKIRFRGDIPEGLRKLLREAIPALLAYAAERGLRLRDLNHEVHILDKATFEKERGAPVPAKVSLPAASYQADPLYRIYTVRVVLDDRPPSTESATAILRVVMARLLGDIFLREEVFPGEAYREEMAARGAEVSAGLEEKILLLEGLPLTTPELEQALRSYGGEIGMNYKRFPDKVRKAWFQDVARQWEAQTEAPERKALAPERQALIEALFEKLSADTKADPARTVRDGIEAVEALDRQMRFLPPDEAPDYLHLRERNPPHYLRSANLRLEFLIQVIASLLDDVAELEPEGGTASPLIEEHLDGHLAELRGQGLARPYLIPNVKLSDDLKRKREAFPFEVHALLDRLPPAGDRDKALRSLEKRLTESLYQRLYTVLIDVKAWIRNRELGRDDAFRGGKRYQAIRGQISNLRFRLPFLKALNARLGFILDSLETGASPEDGRASRFPVEDFARAWSYFVAARVVAGGIPAAEGLLPRFDAARFRGAVDEAVVQAIARGPSHYHLVRLLDNLCEEAGEEGLRIATELVRRPSGTFRYAINRALAAPAAKAGGSGIRDGQKAPAARLEQLAQWARLVMQAREKSQENAIVPGSD